MDLDTLEYMKVAPEIPESDTQSGMAVIGKEILYFKDRRLQGRSR